MGFIMSDIGIFFGSDTGNTMELANRIQQELANYNVETFDIGQDATDQSFEKYNKILIGVPTWYYGEVQIDWDDFIPELEKIDFTGKKVGIFGCGDQEDYSEYFLDAMGILGEIITKNGGVIVGHWPTEGYEFEESKALVNDNHFIGLGIDYDRQPELTETRVQEWVKQIVEEMEI